eukprot:TRINITY_DN10735_c0_g1_i1.p1 TRINITY_DN10735_c0_g1~~TRINITY_DN10735_c0_g1_i1.p1  ORF type:complete len:1447 (+),score=221.67 TRINITY_DN10735_c0_g1_i1:257-4597(+)
MSAEKQMITFVIQNKQFTYYGKAEHRERDFFQLFIKALKGTPGNNAVEGIRSFRENVPESTLSDEELTALYLKHERRRVERDRKKKVSKKTETENVEVTDKAQTPPTTPEDACTTPPPVPDRTSRVFLSQTSLGQQSDSKDAPSPQGGPSTPPLPPAQSPVADETPETPEKDPVSPPNRHSVGSEGGAHDNVLIEGPTQPDEQDEPIEEESCKEVEAPFTAISTSNSFDRQTAVSDRQNPRRSSEGNMGWAPEPTRREHTAWERELMRRRDRAEKEKKVKDTSSSPLAPPPPPPQRSSSPPIPHSAPDTMHSLPRRHRTSKGSSSDLRAKLSKERRKYTESMQRMMCELLEKTNEIQGRVTQLETASPRVGSSEGTSVAASNPHLPVGLPGGMIQQDSDILNLVKSNEQGKTLLHDAAERGAVESVARLLTLGPDVDARDREGRTPFLVAAGLGHLSIVHLLSSKGASIDAEDNLGLSAAALACQGNHSTTVEYLHLRGCNVNTADRYGRTPLHHAVHPTPDALKVLLAINGLDINVRDKIKAQTAIHYAAARGYMEAVGELLTAGATLVVDYDGNGPLNLAIQAGHREITETLIAHSSTGRGWSAIHECVLMDGNLHAFLLSRKEAVDLNEPDARGQTPLMLATLTSNLTTVEFLLSQGVDPRHTDDLGRTALHIAASRGQVAVCRALVKGGAAIDSEDAFRLTPLHAAELHGHYETVSYLTEQGAEHLLHSTVADLVELTRRQRTSSSPLVVNALRSDICGKILTETNDIHGRVVLHAACFVGDEDGVKYILSTNTADLAAADTRGWTALHWAAARDRMYDKRSEGEDVSATHLTPLMVANVKMRFSIGKSAAQVGVIKAVLSKTDDPNGLLTKRARDGRRPVDVAVAEKCDRAVIAILTPETGYPQYLYLGKRWVVVAVVGLIWGIVVLGPYAVYTLVRRRRVSSVMGSFGELLRLAGEGKYANTTAVKKAVGAALWVLILGFFVVTLLIPTPIVDAHTDPPPRNESLPPTDHFDYNQSVRDGALISAGFVICAVQLFCAGMVLVHQRAGELPTRVVSKSIDLTKKGNWAMILLAIADPLILSAVPFTVLHNDSMFAVIMRSLLLDTVAPVTAVIIAYGVVLGWIGCAGVACLCASITSHPKLSRKIRVLQNDTLRHLPPYSIHVLTHTVYLPVVFSLLRIYKCDYNTAGETVMILGSEHPCYETHIFYTLSFFTILVYGVTCGTMGLILGQPKGGEADIFWSYPTLGVEKAAFSVIGWISAIWWDFDRLCLVVYFFAVACLLVYAGKIDDKTPTMPYVIQWRLLGYSFCILVLAISVFLTDQGKEAAGVTCFTVSFFITLVLAVVLYRWNQRQFITAERAQAFRKLHAFSRDSHVPPTPQHTNPIWSRVQTTIEIDRGGNELTMSDDGKEGQGSADGKDVCIDGWVVVNEQAPAASSVATDV